MPPEHPIYDDTGVDVDRIDRLQAETVLECAAMALQAGWTWVGWWALDVLAVRSSATWGSLISSSIAGRNDLPCMHHGRHACFGLQLGVPRMRSPARITLHPKHCRRQCVSPSKGLPPGEERTCGGCCCFTSSPAFACTRRRDGAVQGKSSMRVRRLPTTTSIGASTHHPLSGRLGPADGTAERAGPPVAAAAAAA